MAKLVVPSVGVVIANHNNGLFVGQAIESVARQTMRNIQVVVVDDASTDDSDVTIRQTLDRLNDSRFRYVKLESNRGQAGAVRCGLTELTTPFVCFLDSDDLWYEDFVACHLAVHLNADFPVSLTYCDSHIVDASGQMLAGTAWWFESELKEPSHRPINSSLIPKITPTTGEVDFAPQHTATLHACWRSEWSSNSMAGMMFRKSFIDLILVPPDDALRLYLDFYLSTFAALLTGTIAIDSAYYAYRMHGNNKHSDGVVLGGRYNPSKKQWEPLRDSILRQVYTVLQSEASALRDAFGAHRHEAAVKKVRTALKSGHADHTKWHGSKLHELFRRLRSFA